MADNFSPQEILKIAIRVEENGRDLYSALEEKDVKKDVKDMWVYLKQQEKMHIQVFQNMLDEAGDYFIADFGPGDYQLYINAIASEYIVTQQLLERKIKEGFSSDLAAIEFGLSIEKESILVYSALKDYMLTAKQNIIEKVIDEEKGHFAQLSLLQQSLSKGEL